MDSQVVQIISSNDRKRRVPIVRREDGLYSYITEHFSDHEHEMCWIPTGAKGLYDSQKTAFQEAQGNVDWLVTEAG